MDLIFKALADPARRDILDALRIKDGQSLSDLETNFTMTRFGVMKHLGVLEDAGLITTRKQGRFKYHYINALPLQEAIDRWLDPLRVKPAARGMLDLKSRLESETTPPRQAATDGSQPKGHPQVTDMTPVPEGTPMTDPKPDFVMQTFIRCSLDALWDALTDPDEMANYHFLAQAIRKEGDTTHFEFEAGQPMMRARDIRLDPKSRIEQTFEGLWEGAGEPSRYVYHLKEEGDVCSLTLEHYDLTFPVAYGEGVADGWARLLAGLKTYLETGETVRFSETATGV
ncbi:ArsR/SmtB family transcription factor [Shimia ponticola]|uniref:ArsR/SmtB family transcription factor n=1 Tax=Shimia ponticola TaxID=2582893 RepID=UPI0011BD97CC|nr:metalloregulator ArsR/SmtB family transcription factor [Shimia ponticola]